MNPIPPRNDPSRPEPPRHDPGAAGRPPGETPRHAHARDVLSHKPDEVEKVPASPRTPRAAWFYLIYAAIMLIVVAIVLWYLLPMYMDLIGGGEE